MADKALVIVESPTKAKTITKFLGPNYIVRASNGHIRDLPESAADIPAKLKKEGWSRLGVNVDRDFEPIYVVPKNKREHIKDLQEELKQATMLYLATDEDREGESISWHLLEVLKPKVPVKRLVFHEITKEAIQHSLETARQIDEDLVRAQETRRIVDRLFGYEVSPLLWKKMAPGLSAGRVQSVAVRLLVERERARIRFRAGKFWGLKAKLNKPGVEPNFEAELVNLAGKRVAVGRDFDPETGKLTDANAVFLMGQSDAERVAKLLEAGPVTVKSVEEKPFTQKPYAPFLTSTLQIEANSKLRYSARRTMQVAQQLYENGFITYMRTDSTTLSSEAIKAARTLITKQYGESYLPAAPRVYETKVKNAQEAHEAIRPAGETFQDPEIVRERLGDESFRLYDLIYKRTVACQMADARGTFTNVSIEAGDAVLRASGKTIAFAGFLKAYVNSDAEEGEDQNERILPAMTAGDALRCEKAEPSEKTTQAPARFTEGSLIKELERLGIGRPSTWASIVDVVLNRSYAFKKGSALVPTFTAMAVVNLLEGSFSNYLDYTYTARLEDDLDAISRGELANLDYLKKFYFGSDGHGLRELLETGQREIDPRIINGISLIPESETEKLEVRIGRYGPFVSDGERRASVPEDTAPDELTAERALVLLDNASKEPESLGLHPDTGEPVYLKVGRFGPYVQLGDPVEGAKTKPKMASLVPGTELSAVDLAHACKLLTLPRNLGIFPDNSEKIMAANGRFGPYIQAGSETRSLPSDISPIDVTLEKAIELLRQPRLRGRGAARQTSLKDFGANPASGKVVKLLSGRYGPYVTDGEINATVARGQDPMQLTPEQAFELLAARALVIAENGGPTVKRGAKKAAKKAATKAAPKKAAKRAAKSAAAEEVAVEVE